MSDSNLLQLPATPSFDPNPLEHPNGFDFTGLPSYAAQQIDSLYQQLYNQQGNNQAGDATSSWTVTTQVTDQALHQIGAQGRFVHPTYGVIMARYVQFTKIDSTLWTGSPVGYCDEPGGFMWRATNDLTQSHTSGLIGVMGSFTMPTEGQYGWVITDGINTQGLQFIGNNPPSAGDLLTWSSSGNVALAQAGAQGGFYSTVVGRVVSIDKISKLYGDVWQLTPAAVHITATR